MSNLQYNTAGYFSHFPEVKCALEENNRKLSARWLERKRVKRAGSLGREAGDSIVASLDN